MNALIKLCARVIFGLRDFETTWLACKKKYKVLLMEYKNDKHSNKTLAHDKRECQQYEHMVMWDGERASVVNQMPPNAQQVNEHHTNEATQHYLPSSATNEKKMKQRQKEL